MRLINKKTICAATLGLLLLYIIRKRKTADERPVSNEDAPEYASMATDAPVVSVPSVTHPFADAPADSAHDTQADADVAAHPDISPYEDAFEQTDVAIDGTPPADSDHDTQTDADVAAHPDISPYEDAFEQTDVAIDGTPPADSAHDTQANTDVTEHPDISPYEDAFGQEDAALDEPPPADNTQDTQADTAIDEPLPASEATPKPKSPVSPQRKPSAQPSPKRQRRTMASMQSTRQYRPPGYMGRRIPSGVYYPPLSPPSQKASLRCRETAGEWEIYLALPQARAAVKVTHGGDELRVSSETELPLSQFAGEVVVHYQDNAADRITLLNATDGKPLFFKMQKDWGGEGRLVNNPTVGYVLAIAPLYYIEEWDADEPHYPEDCVDENFEARFLFLEGATPDRPAPMAIKGETIHDDADLGHHGKLYVGAPPELQVDHQITDARIVEETGVRELNKWGENFNPHRQSIASALDRREGRFSIRAYHDGDLQESKPFRYFPALRRITLNGEPHSPDIALLPDKRTGQHSEMALRFELDDGDVLRPERVSHHDEEVRVADDGAVIIPPSPSVKTLTCHFTNRASIAVAMPRVWWRLTDENGAIGDWGGETYEFSRSEFMSLTKARIEISAPPAIKAVEVGFGDETMNEFKTRQSAVEFDMWGFVYHKEVFDALDKTLHLNIRVNGQTAPILRVLADATLDESAADKALLNLFDRYTARAMPSASSHELPFSSTARRSRRSSGAHDVRLIDRMKRPDTLKKGSAVFGDVVDIGQSAYLLKITGKSGQTFRGILPWTEMITMAETERAEIIIGRRLPVYVIEDPESSPSKRALLSVDRLPDADHDAGEE